MPKFFNKPPFYRTIYNFFHKYKSNGWVFTEFRKIIFIGEYVEWEMFYLPVSVKGLTVLDVGAGEGETARFYLEHGAKKVICIEPEKEAFKLLALNAKNKPIECFQKTFDLFDLRLSFDVLKMDIEGYEEVLLTIPKLTKPCIIEVHGLPLMKKFLDKGYKLMSKPNGFSNSENWFGYITN